MHQPSRQSAACRISTCAVVLILAGLASAFAQTRSFIFESAPFPSCHASTIVQLRKGEFMAAWFGGSAEGKPDVAIWSATTVHGRWTDPVVTVREPDVPAWNPVLFHAGNGRLWLYYKFGPSYTWWTAGRRYSDDEGVTWSPIEHLPAGLLGPIRTKPLLEPDGTLLSGTSVESYTSWAAWVERSTDNGLTWSTHGPIEMPPPAQTATGSTAPGNAPFGIIQPTILWLSATHLRLYARSSPQIARICISDSWDNGASWSPARALDLPNPNSGIDLVKLQDGRIVLIYNDTNKGRSPLNLAVSRDGEHFREFYELETGPGEFSYPAIIQAADGDLRLTYTWNRKKIRYVIFPLARIP